MITIGMPVYNEAAYVREAIESLLAQTHTDLVLLIADNASTDGTSDICNHYAARDPRIRYVRHPENIGARANLEYLRDAASAPYFAWASGHDVWHPRFVEALLPLVSERGTVLAYPRTRRIDLDGALGKVYRDDHTNVGTSDPAERFRRIVRRLGVCNIFHGVWKTQVLQTLRIRESYSPDSLLLAEASLLGCFAQHPEVLFFRRQVRARQTEREKVDRAYRAVTGRPFRGLLIAAQARYIREHWSIIANAPGSSAVQRAGLCADATAWLGYRYVIRRWALEQLSKQRSPV